MRDCSGNPFLLRWIKGAQKRLKRKARPAGARPTYFIISKPGRFLKRVYETIKMSSLTGLYKIVSFSPSTDILLLTGIQPHFSYPAQGLNIDSINRPITSTSRVGTIYNKGIYEFPLLVYPLEFLI